MGRPKKVKTEDQGKEHLATVRKNFNRRCELVQEYEYALEEYACLATALEEAKKELEKTLAVKIKFENENEWDLSKLD